MSNQWLLLLCDRTQVVGSEITWTDRESEVVVVLVSADWGEPISMKPWP